MKVERIGDATLYTGDCLDVLRGLRDESVHCCVTSPPYFGLRDYGVDGQIGLEASPAEYVARMVGVFEQVRRVLRDDGTLWLNLGDSYAGGGNYRGINSEETLSEKQRSNGGARGVSERLGFRNLRGTGLKAKDLIGIPWRVAFALQDAGWYLRQDIIWSKPNPMPESVTDRCTKSHEYIFMLSKSARYYYDQDAIKEPAIYSGLTGQDDSGYKDAKKFNGKHGTDKQSGHGRRHAGFNKRWKNIQGNMSDRGVTRTTEGLGMKTSREKCPNGVRNRRSVWTVATQPFAEAHFATFPPDLIRPCVMAGCPPGGTVLDPFSGSGTAGMVALQEGRRYVGIELNPDYQHIAIGRITPAANQGRLFA